MKYTALILLLFAGCAQFRTVQTDTSSTTNGATRNVTTSASAVTLMAGKQALAKWRATQTDKSQTASVGGITQESDATALVQAMGEILMKGLAAYLTGGGAAIHPAPEPAETKSLGIPPK